MGLDNNANSGYGRTPFNWNYVFDFTGFYGFCNSLIDGTINSGSYAITNFFTSFSDYVVKAQIYPFSLDNFFDVTSVTSMYFGKTSITQNGYYLTINGSGQGAPIKKWCSIALSRTFNNFLDFAPYTKIQLYLPFFDIIDLPLEKCYGYNIDVYLSIDQHTGKSTVWLVRYEDGLMIYTNSTKLSIDLPLGKTNAEEKERNNILQAVSGLGSAIGLAVGVYTGNPLVTAGSVGMLTKNVTSALNNNVDRLTSYKGGAESVDKWVCDKNIYLIAYRPQNIKYPDYHLKGAPNRTNDYLYNYSGYTEIGEIHFNPSGYDIYDDEISELTDLLRNGVIL